MQGLRFTHAFQMVRVMCASLAVGAFLVLATIAFADDVPSRERSNAPPNPAQNSPRLVQPEQPLQPRQLEPQQAQQEEQIRLGIAFDHEADLSRGIEVGEVMPGGVADEAGLKAGDVVMTIDGTAVTSAEQLDQIVQQHAPGDEVVLMVVRDGERQNMNVKFRYLSRGNQEQGEEVDATPVPRHGWLGITLQREEEDQQGEQDQQEPGQPRRPEQPAQQAIQPGAEVASVFPASPAARAGMHPGDRILQINGEAVASVDHLLETLKLTSAGDMVELVVLCEGEERTYSARLEDRGVFQVAGEVSPDSPYTWHDPNGFDAQITAEDLMLEQHRLVMEQHERMENMLYEMQDDLAAIKRELGILRGDDATEARQPAQEPAPPVRERRQQQPTENQTNPN